MSLENLEKNKKVELAELYEKYKEEVDIVRKHSNTVIQLNIQMDNKGLKEIESKEEARKIKLCFDACNEAAKLPHLH